MNRGLVHLTCCVLLLGGSGALVWGQANQIQNPEFDNGLTSWGRYGTTGYTVSVVTGAQLSGANAALIDVTDASVTSIGISQGGLKFERGKKYPVGVTAKADKEREMVILIQLHKPEGPNWIDIVLQRVALTTKPQTFLFEYTHNDDNMADRPTWSASIYLMLKGAWWPMAGDTVPSKVWLDRVHVGEAPPLADSTNPYAYEPKPADGATINETAAVLEWRRGDFAVTHNVYFSPDAEAVRAGTVAALPAATERIVMGFTPPYAAGLTAGQTYYWRVDEVNEAHPQSPWQGPIWSFLVRPRTAYQPVPADGSKFVETDQDLSWKPGLGVLFHTVYRGDSAEQVANATTGGWMTVDPRWDLGPLEANKTYYWRVDSFTGLATHKGPVWSFTTAGPGGGLKAEYFNNRDLSGPAVVTRTDPRIDFNWGNGDVPGRNSPDPKINVNDFSARWTGELAVDRTDTYVFTVTANNGFRLWLDGRPIIDFWDNATTETRRSGPVPLTAGQTYPLRLEYFEGTDVALVQLLWESAVQSRIDTRVREIVPRGALGLPLKAHSPVPANGAVNTAWSLDLAWTAGDLAKQHEVYFGTNATAVAQAGPTTAGIYRQRLALGTTTYTVSNLEWGRTYYWRVDEIDTTNPAGPWKGSVWSFTTADFIVVDDFEDYTDAEGNRIYETWIDGWTNNTGSMVGYEDAPFAEQKIVHGGKQALPLKYNNEQPPWYSEAERTWSTPQDWTVGNSDTLILYVRGQAGNGPERLYVSLHDSTGKTATVVHPNPSAAQATLWTPWRIPLVDFAGVNASRIKKMVIGLGNRASPKQGGAGLIYLDDLRVGK
ncbi:MAG: hypothetical protein FJ280_09260 [Planctomycetes bacterium]|nr:hypothetical protein [Planctomycetota bacterium]